MPRLPVPPSVSVIGGGLLLTLLQLLLVLSMQGRATWESAYKHLFQWDSVHYVRLVDEGYRSTLPPSPEHLELRGRFFTDHTNAGFFPGYPLAGTLVRRVTGFSARTSLLLAAQLAAWTFWSLLLAWIWRSRLPRGIAAGAVAAVFVHPSAFYLVTAYSESLFCASLLGYLLWSRGAGAGRMGLAVLSGVAMTATRIFGLPVALFPVIEMLVRPGTRTAALARSALIAIAASSGFLLFLLYCHLQFGHWDLYFLTQKVGWGLTPDFLFPFRGIDVLVPWRDLATPQINAHSRIAFALTTWLLVLLLAAEWVWARRSRSGLWRERVSLYVCAVLLLYLTGASLATSGMASAIRYVFVPFLLLVLAAAGFVAVLPRPHGALRWVLAGGWFAMCAALLIYQLSLADAFTHGGWVA